eukprot:TRINITY_DN2486_c0_g1_i1.p1 TRINITY_DN2486_c0_g1~~TRINITY_DN2486_c0_g1_i1.p1  ORF type:complete len:427 (+),score=144.59 TRINITY_DN2486_c0_g1_i1:63-1283(+)
MAFSTTDVTFGHNPCDNMETRRQIMKNRRWHEKYVTMDDEQAEWRRQRALREQKGKAVAKLASFQKGSMKRSGIKLTDHITGMSFTHNEIVRAAGVREQIVRRVLEGLGVPARVISFTAPPEMPQQVFSARDMLGEAGDSHRESAKEYNDQARKNYNASMTAILEYARDHVSGGESAVNAALAEAQQELVWQTELAGHTPTMPEDWVYPDAAKRKRLFQEIDKNSNGLLSLAEIDLAVRSSWPSFNHREALIRAYKLADMKGAQGRKDGLLSRSDDESKCEFSRFLKYLHLYVDYWDKFAQFDVDGDRTVDLAEWKMRGAEIFPDLSAEEMEMIFDELDADGGGRVRFNEFCAWGAKTFGDRHFMASDEAEPFDPQRMETFRRARQTRTWRAGPRVPVSNAGATFT